jgi:hypothetical protein
MTMLAVEYYNAQDCVGSNFAEILKIDRANVPLCREYRFSQLTIRKKCWHELDFKSREI